MRFLLAFVLLCFVVGQGLSTPTPTPTPAPEPLNTTAEEIFNQIILIPIEDLNASLVASNLSGIAESSYDNTTFTITFVPIDQPPANFTEWADTLQILVCDTLNLTDCGVLNQTLNYPISHKRNYPAVKVTKREAAVAPIPTPTPPAGIFSVSYSVLIPDSIPTPGETPTPTPDETPTPTPLETPTPGETPTPTPGETPTPTPSPSPSPSPSGSCTDQCHFEFEGSEASWDSNTTFTIRCRGWTDLRSCIQSCGDSSDALATEKVCLTTQYILDVCDCGDGVLPFDGPRLVQLLVAYQDGILSQLESIPGVISVTWPSTVNGNWFSVDYVWDNDFQSNGNTVSKMDILSAVQARIADYLNTASENVVIRDGRVKRAQQDDTFTVILVESGSYGSHISVSFAFILVSVLLHVLF